LDDAWCIEFCHLNNRGARRRLVRTLFNVSRTSLELLSHYSRIAAVLSQELPDIGITLVQQLEDEFGYHLRKKDPHTLEAKVKNIRFLGELTKVRVADANVALTCLKDCLEDFTQHNVDVACHLLETCGRYLYRRRDAHVRCRHLIETMMRLRSVKHLDPRQDGLVENAYFLCRPPEKSNKLKKQRPVLHEYIRKLLLQDLTRDQLDTVLVRLRRLPWPEAEDYVLKTLIGISKGRYQSIPLAASVVAGLSRFYENIAIHLVDQLIDEILCGLQHAPVFGQQRSIANVRFIGELYNYEVINSRMVFFVLWSLLYHAHVDGSSDGPDDTFRIRLACTLLETSGEYFSSGVPGKRLEFFMLALTKFALVQNSKRELPLDVEFVISDTFDALRPGFKLPKRVEECERMMAALKAKVNGRVEFDPNMLKVFNSGNAQEVSDEEEEEREGQGKGGAEKGAGSSSDDGSGSDEAEEEAVVMGDGEDCENSDDEIFDRDFDKMCVEYT
jgi:regulator of nonsense transcripts 2